jgi:hypothetical protein
MKVNHDGAVTSTFSMPEPYLAVRVAVGGQTLGGEVDENAAYDWELPVDGEPTAVGRGPRAGIVSRVGPDGAVERVSGRIRVSPCSGGRLLPTPCAASFGGDAEFRFLPSSSPFTLKPLTLSSSCSMPSPLGREITRQPP